MFSIGDRVRVSDDWFSDAIRGWIGTVAAPPAGLADQRNDGIYWVEFDTNVMENREYPITGAEIDANYLALVNC